MNLVPRAGVLALATAIVSSFFFTSAPARAGGSCYDAFAANLKLHSYRTTITTSHGAQTIDLILPDRMHMTGKGMEMISVGNHSWMRMGGAGWKPLSIGTMNISQMVATARQNLDAKKPGTSCTDAGMGFYHGQPAHVYTIASQTGASGPTSGKAYVFADGYVHHFDTTTTHGSIAMDFSDFNSVSISPP